MRICMLARYELAGAAADQTRPRLMETLDLLRGAIVMRLRRTTLPTALASAAAP